LVSQEGQVLYIQYVTWNHWGGNFNSTHYPTTGTGATPTIRFYNSHVVFQEGSADTTSFNGPTKFESSISNGYYYDTEDIYTVVYNTSNIEIAWAEFDSVNVIFNYDGTISNSNFTGYATLNTTSSASVWITGDTVTLGPVIFSGLDVDAATGEFWVTNTGAFDPDGNVFLAGKVYFVNDGTITTTSTTYIYADTDSWFVNTGLIDIAGDYIYLESTQFPDNTYHDVGTVVNRGTIQFSKNGAEVIFDDGKNGQFYQCNDGIIKYYWDNTVSSGYYSQFSQLSVDGWIGVIFDKDYTVSYQTLFTWETSHYQDVKDYPKQGFFDGNVAEFTKGPGTIASPQILCGDATSSTTTGRFYLYPLSKGSCSKQTGVDKASNSINPSPTGGVCNKNNVPESITKLEASCSSDKNCGLDTGKPPFQSGNANNLPVSLALLVSLIGLLFSQY
jgi:hypothetical protein